MPQNEEEFAALLQEELRRLKVSDVLVQTVFTLSSLGFERVAGEARDLGQAKLAIDALRGLLPVLAGVVPAEVTRDFNQMLANLQLAFAKAAKEAAATPEPPPAAGGGDATPAGEG